MKNIWGEIGKRILLCMLLNVIVLIAGAAFLAMLISKEIIGLGVINYGSFVILLISAFLSCLLALKGQDGKVLINGGLGAAATLLIITIGSALQRNSGGRNIVGSALVVLAGAGLAMLLKMNSKVTQKGDWKNKKMVNLYKKRVG